MSEEQGEKALSEQDKVKILQDWTVGTHYGCSIEKVKDIHKKSADIYDKFYKEVGWSVPIESATQLHKHLQLIDCTEESLILDIGAGTGLVGQALFSMGGYKNLIGVDISKEMLAEAEKKNIYKKLIEADLSINHLESYQNKCDAVISIGAFTAGQLQPVVLEMITKLIRKGGLMCISFRDVTWEKKESGFANKIDELLKRCELTLLDNIFSDYHKALNEKCYLLVLKRC